MNVKELAKRHAYLYSKTEKWSEAWLKSYCDLIYEMLLREDVTRISLPLIGTISKTYKYPQMRYDINKQQKIMMPGRMTLTFTPSAKLDEKIKALPENPELASAATKKYRSGDMPEKRVEPEEEMEE